MKDEWNFYTIKKNKLKMNKERIIKNLRAIADAYEKGEKIYFDRCGFMKSEFNPNDSFDKNLGIIDLEMNDYITESEHNRIKHQHLVGKWLVSKDGNTKHKIVEIEGNLIRFGNLHWHYDVIKLYYTLENGESL